MERRRYDGNTKNEQGRKFVKKFLSFDVYAEERFVKTFRIPYDPIFATDSAELEKFVLERIPTLKNKKNVRIYFNN